MKKLLLITTILLSSFLILEGRHRHIFSRVSQQEGLTSTVNCICKEKDGDVWIGTPNGLYSFNGYTLKHYNIPIFKGSKVYHTSFDSNKNLWVLTNKCIAVKFADQNTFTKLEVPDSYTSGPFNSLAYGNDCVWIGTVGRIYKYDYSAGRLTLFCTLPPKFDCKTMCMLDENTILTCSREGKLKINTSNGKICNATFGDILEITATMMDSKERVWMAFYNKGIQVFTKGGELICSYNTQNSTLSNDIVLCLAEREGMILA